VAVSGSIELRHVEFGLRRRYGDAHALGLALGHVEITGNGSGGNVTHIFTAPTGFLYRLEALNAIRADVITDTANVIFTHVMLEANAGLGSADLNLSYPLERAPTGTAGGHTIRTADRQSERRIPIGQTERGPVTTVCQVTFNTNTNTVVYLATVVLAYWRQEAMFRPGFLSAFWETPILDLPLTER